MFNFSFFSICSGCKKRRWYISRRWFKPKYLLAMPKVQPKEKMCNKCISSYKNLKQDDTN